MIILAELEMDGTTEFISKFLSIHKNIEFINDSEWDSVRETAHYYINTYGIYFISNAVIMIDMNSTKSLEYDHFRIYHNMVAKVIRLHNIKNLIEC
jgi:hypothetical protein